MLDSPNCCIVTKSLFEEANSHGRGAGVPDKWPLAQLLTSGQRTFPARESLETCIDDDVLVDARVLAQSEGASSSTVIRFSAALEVGPDQIQRRAPGQIPRQLK